MGTVETPGDEPLAGRRLSSATAHLQLLRLNPSESFLIRGYHREYDGKRSLTASASASDTSPASLSRRMFQAVASLQAPCGGLKALPSKALATTSSLLKPCCSTHLFNVAFECIKIKVVTQKSKWFLSTLHPTPRGVGNV
jgi:hypothetical protein